MPWNGRDTSSFLHNHQMFNSLTIDGTTEKHSSLGTVWHSPTKVPSECWSGISQPQRHFSFGYPSSNSLAASPYSYHSSCTETKWDISWPFHCPSPKCWPMLHIFITVTLSNGICDHSYNWMGYNSTSSFHNISLADTGQNLHSRQQNRLQRKTVS